MKALFIDSVHPSLAKKLESIGYACDLRYDIRAAEVKDMIGRYDGLVLRSKVKADRALLDAATNLKWIARYGSGMENIDVAYAAQKGIRCLAAPEGNRDAVGDHALGMLLSLMKNIGKSWDEVRKGIWEREGNRGTELDGKTVGIIGYGNTGPAFARRLQGFEVRVLAYDKYKKGFGDDRIKEATMEDIFVHADVLSLHVPLTEETRFMVDSAFLERFQKPVFFINTSRGPIVRTADLVRAMEEGKILGCGLDVLEYEDLSFEKLRSGEMPEALSRLMAHPRAMITPHIAGWSFESYEKLAVFLAEKIKEVTDVPIR